VGRLLVLARDSRGGPISDAQVLIWTNSGATTHLTGADGLAKFDNLTCGSWNVRASKDGFQEEGRAVEISGNVELKLTMNPQVVHDSVDVSDTAPTLEQSSSGSNELHTDDMKNLPGRPATVADSLPLVPGVVRSPDGEIKIDGSGEQRSAFVVNQTDVTDPATGKFGQTVPVDSVETVNVLSTPFLAQYGRFTSGVVAVQTRRGGDKWHAELNDPLPDFRFRSWHMRGLRDSTARGVASGPLIEGRLYFISTLQYSLVKAPERTLPFPFNESKQESVNSLTQFDYVLSPRQMLTATFHLSPQHINFVHPEYFNPQPVTPSFAQHNYVATVGDHWTVGRGTLDSVVSLQRFDAVVGAQGEADMVLTPTGNRGNYFGSQNREAGRSEWQETWSPAQIESAGRHDLKFGGSLSLLTDSGLSTARPIDILSTAGLLLRRVDFTGGSPYDHQDLETVVFAQDHWNVNPRLALDFGARFEHQSVSDNSRVAPRVGLAWTPFAGGRTTLRGGYGEFYDRVPLSVYTFRHYPQRVVTDYAPDGTILGTPVQYMNVLGTAPNTHAPGNFAPRSATWNVQLEQRFSHLLRIRALYADSRSDGLVVLEPLVLDTVNALPLNGLGRSVYRQAEVTARLQWKSGQQLIFAYTRSRAQGTLNDFSSFLGNFPVPLIRPNVYSNLAGDLPNRFLAWGRVNLPWRLEFLPLIEYRDGFPYARVDTLGDYVGMPNSDLTRFPRYFAADARILKDLKVNPKYTLRFSVSGFDLSNHFNALSVHANVDDPQYGVFFGNYHRRYRADFDVLF
jgi:hypothetical protein